MIHGVECPRSMPKPTRVVSPEHLAKMHAAAKAARKARAAKGRKCGACGRKVRPSGFESDPYVRSTTRPGVIYCWPGTGCWLERSSLT